MNVSALTRAEYQFTDGKEVLFFSTVAENPNIGQIQDVAKVASFKEFTDLPTHAADDVWCRIETHTDSPILYLECYQPHGGHGVSVHNDYNPTAGNGISILGYDGLIDAVAKIRTELRTMLHDQVESKHIHW